jgi:hypothetical protein
MIHFGHESVGGSCAGDFGTKAGTGAAAASSTARELVRTVLKELSVSFGMLYSSERRPSIPPVNINPIPNAAG